MEIINKRLTLQEFRDYVKRYDFGSLPADKLVLHHTWRPAKEAWQGEWTIAGLKKYYEQKGWPVGPHLFVAEDGIWLFTPMRKNGIHAGSLNPRSIGIEVVGDYNTEKWSGQTKVNALGAIQVLMERLGLTENDIFFHRDASPKSCPGWAITKEWLFKELSELHIKPRVPTAGSGPPEALSAPAPVNPPPDSEDMVFIPVPAWAQEAVDFVVTHRLFKITCSEDIRDAVKFYRFYLLIRQHE